MELTELVDEFTKLEESIGLETHELSDLEKGTLFLIHKMMPSDSVFAAALVAFVSSYSHAYISFRIEEFASDISTLKGKYIGD